MTLLIQSPDPKTKIVEDWDFTFTSGFMLPVTIDREAGDTIAITDKLIKIHLARKPSPRELDSVLKAEDITIFCSQLLVIQTRERDMTELTDAQKAEWSRTLQEISIQ